MTTTGAGDRPCGTCGHLNRPDTDFCTNPLCRTFLGWTGTPTEPVEPPPTSEPTTGPATTEPTTSAQTAVPTTSEPTRSEPTRSEPTRREPPRSEPTTAEPTPTEPPGQTDRDTSTQPVDPATPLGYEQRSGVRLRLEPAEVAVEPGGAAIVRVVAENTGTRVEQLALRIDGAGGAFAVAEPATLSVYADGSEQAVVTFRPGRGPQPAAGPAAFRVEARSTIHPDVVADAAGVVTVGPYVEVSAELEPPVSRGRRPSPHTVLVTNGGNAAADVEVELADRDGVLTFAPAEAAVAVPAGATVAVATTVGGPRSLVGRPKSHQFTATLTPPRGQPAVTVNGVRHQRPLLPWWVPAAALLLVVALVAVLPRLGQATVPKVQGLSRADAEATLAESGYLVRVAERTDPAITAGLAIGTVPGEGAKAKKGAQVTLFVSTGVCAGDACPATVPPLRGLRVAQAKEALEKAGLTFARQVVVKNNEVAKGLVVSSDPVSGAQVERRLGVVLTVSGGPVDDRADVLVPDVRGKSKQDAFNLLVAAGLQVVERAQPSPVFPAGIAVGTDPPKGTKVKEGNKVTLVVSSGPRVAAEDDDFVLFPGGIYDFDANREGDETAADLVYEEGRVFATEGRGAALIDGPATFEACRDAELREEPIPAEQLAPDKVICVRTQRGRLAVVRLKSTANSGEFTAEYKSYVVGVR